MSKMIKFNFNKTNINNIHGLVILRPGVNEIPEDEWEKVKDTDQIKEWTKKGIILMISDKPAPPVIEEPVKKAADLIAEIEKATDIDALKELKKGEDRKTVLKAIKAQIKFLEEKGKDNKSDEDKKEAEEQKTIAKIKTITVIEDLEKLKEAEKSKDVLEAIDAQIKVLKELDGKDK